MKTTILWDHDGVLVDTEPWYFEATRISVRALGVDLARSDYLADMAIGRPAWDRARELGAAEEQIADHQSRRNSLYQSFLRSRNIDIPGVEQVLSDLGRDFRMAIVTTSRRSDFDLIHEHRSITAHMTFVLCNGDYSRSKPHPDPYLTALERFDATRDETVVIEDSERGLKAALAAGIDCVVVASRFVEGQNLDGATSRINDISELPALLRDL